MTPAASNPSDDTVSEITSIFGIHMTHVPEAVHLNRSLNAACERLFDDPDTRRTHFVHGRFENLYPPKEKLPEMAPLIREVERAAREILGTEAPLRIGFWLNRMDPGHQTSLHTHEEDDELLSAVYYVTVPAHSGRLVFRDPPGTLFIDPEPGMLLLFPPDLPHEVEMHEGTHTRLSIAFNIGPEATWAP